MLLIGTLTLALASGQWSTNPLGIHYTGGNVGIGTNNPTFRLFVRANTGTTSIYGLHLGASGSVYGVFGESRSNAGIGVYGFVPSTTGTTYGVHGRSASTAGRGVYGEATATTGTTFGVIGQSASNGGIGVLGKATATTGETYGVYGQTESTSGRGVFGYALALTGETYGVYGKSDSTSGRGVYGLVTATTGSAWGVVGETKSTASNAYGVVGIEPGTTGSRGPGHAVYGFGSIAATGTKSFQIDHPLRPETHYLNHFCAEGPEPYNIYRGTVVLDARGEAWVQLPDYFEAINRDPIITLTPVGAPMPNLHVAVEVQGNRFKIAGGLPNRKVFWRVEAIRNDLWVQRYGYETEQPKEAQIRGKYLHPELYGQPKERGIFYRPEPEPAEGEKL